MRLKHLHLATFLAVACLFAPILGIDTATAAGGNKKRAVPDFTQGGKTDGSHDWTLGPTGARGWVHAWKMLETYAAHGKRVIPKLAAAAKHFETEPDFPPSMARDKARIVRETIKKIEASADEPELIDLNL